MENPKCCDFTYFSSFFGFHILLMESLRFTKENSKVSAQPPPHQQNAGAKVTETIVFDSKEKN